MEIIDNHGFFRIEKESPFIGKDKVKIIRNDNPEKFIELTVDQMTPSYLVSRLHQLGIKNVDLSKLDKNNNGTIETVSELSELDALLETNKDFINTQDAHDYVIKSIADPNKNHFVLQVFEKGLNVNIKDGSGKTPLMAASENGNHEVFKFLIKRGADVNTEFHSSWTHKTWTALSYAAVGGHLEMVKQLLKNGAKVDPDILSYVLNENVYDSVYIKETDIQRKEKDIEIVRLLLDAGAKVNVKYDQRPLLMVAIDHQRSDIAELLIQRGADVRAKEITRSFKFRTQERDIFIAAAGKTDSNVLKMLIDKKVDMNTKAIYDRTALMYATERIENVRLLVENGADINARSDGGYTALMFASNEGSVETVKFLIDKGADVNIKNEKGETALDRVNSDLEKINRGDFSRTQNSQMIFIHRETNPEHKQKLIEAVRLQLTEVAKLLESARRKK